MPRLGTPLTAPTHPAAEQMRQLFLAEREHWAKEFGHAPVRPYDQWVAVGGHWRLSCAWLRRAGHETANRGFRICYNGGESFTMEIWAPGTRAEMTYTRGWDEQRLRLALSWAFRQESHVAITA